RPTCSAGLYIQQVGRGTRKAEGKETCLVLDFAGSVRRFGPVDNVRIKTKSRGFDTLAPTKLCPECDEILPLAATECSCCGHAFPRDTAPKHAAHADTVAILGPRRVVSDWMEVDDIEYGFHHKETPSLRVTFQCGIHSFSKWVCLQHRGYARAICTHNLSRDRGLRLAVPVTFRFGFERRITFRFDFRFGFGLLRRRLIAVQFFPTV